jgi:hypothetical protein
MHLFAPWAILGVLANVGRTLCHSAQEGHSQRKPYEGSAVSNTAPIERLKLLLQNQVIENILHILTLRMK